MGIPFMTKEPKIYQSYEKLSKAQVESLIYQYVCSKEKLLQNNLFTLRVLGLEKAKNVTELNDIFQYILQTEKDPDNVQILKEIAYYVYHTALENKAERTSRLKKRN